MADTGDGVLRAWLIKQGFDAPNSADYNRIQTWLDWYRGDVDEVHHYQVYNGVKFCDRRVRSLGMAKVIAEDHANLLLNERVQINVGDERFAEQLDEILQANNFRVRANNLVELAYAIGTGALVEYLDAAGQPAIDYVPGSMVYPLSWDNGEITQCAFVSVQRRAGKKVYYLQLHLTGPELVNVYLDAETGKELPVPDGMAEAVTGLAGAPPLYQIIRPNIVNNADLDSPMGMSVYGNATDQLAGCDLIYDSYINEYVLGRKRIIVPMDMATVKLTESGDMQPVFDPRDVVFYALTSQDGDQGGGKLTEINMAIRAQEHEAGLQRALNMLAKKCGLGNDRYRFDAGGVKTATEVISEKSELYQNLKKNELVLEQVLIGMTRALAYLSGYDPGMDVKIAFDDSIIEDRKSKIDEHIQLVGSGLESKVKAVMDIHKIDKDAAREMLAEIADEGRVGMDALDGIMLRPDEGGAPDGDPGDGE